MSFESDIQGQNTQLFPVVEINGIWYSTNNVTVDGNYCKPILINIPSIKESVDVESRKFKISNVNLKFNNFPFDGVRFSDQLSASSLINTESTIYFKSPSELRQVYKGIIRKISHDDESCNVELEDLTSKKGHIDLPQAKDHNGVIGQLGTGESIPDKYKNKPIPMVYGYVDRSPVVIRDNFIKFQADSKQIRGFYPKSSGYEWASGASITFDSLQVDINGEFYYIKQQGQYTQGLDDNYIELDASVMSGATGQVIDDEDEFNEVALTCRAVAKPRFSINSVFHSDTDANEDYLEPEFGMDNINAITDGSLEINDIGVLGKRDRTLITDFPYQFLENLLLSLNMDVTPNHDTLNGNNIIGFKMNGHNLPQYLGNKILKVNHRLGLVGAGSDASGASWNYATQYHLIWDEGGNINTPPPHYEAINQVFGIIPSDSVPALGGFLDQDMPYSYHDTADAADIQVRFFEEGDTGGKILQMPVILFSGGFNNWFNIQFRTVGTQTFTESYYNSPSVEMKHRVEITGHIDEISLVVENQSVGLFDKDFYANIQGRINTFDGHPFFSEINDTLWQTLYQTIQNNSWSTDLSESAAYLLNLTAVMNGMYSGDEQQLYVDIVNFLNSYDVEVEHDALENPIDIIYDLVRSELGHESIDEAEYLEARDAHLGWKFGFTQNEKINSKDLIEDIAKSTKCFPRFRNDGSFGFNTIKDNYNVNEDYAGATEIKASDVISYSFKKTEPEQIYKKVDVQYNKDYAQDSHIKTTTPIDLGADPYYGIETSSDAHLEFESDHIRNENTANKLTSFLSSHHKNDHLILSIKLPLQYINLEVGGKVKFRELLGGKAFGIDYRRIENPNFQHYYPLFMITYIKKKLDSVSIECMQLHHLSATEPDDDWFEGTLAEDTDGLFYFPDYEVVVPDEEIEPPDDGTEPVGDPFQLRGVILATDVDDDWQSEGSGINPIIAIAAHDTAANFNNDVLNGWHGEIIDPTTWNDSWGSHPNEGRQPFAIGYFTVSPALLSNQPPEGQPNIVRVIYDRYTLDSNVVIPSDWDVETYPNRFLITFMHEYIDPETGEIMLVADPVWGTSAGLGMFTDAILSGGVGSNVDLVLTPYVPIMPEETLMMGDVNFDDTLNILDVLQVVNYMLGNLEFSDDQIAAGDMNNDTGINVLDIVQIVNIILGDS